MQLGLSTAQFASSPAMWHAQIMVQPFGGMSKRGYKCVGLTEESSDEAMFMNAQENREMSVTEYFQGRYQKR